MTIQAIGYSTDYQVQTKNKSSTATGFDMAQLAIGSFGPAAIEYAGTKSTSAESITAAAVNASYGSAAMAAGMSRSYAPSALSVGGSGLGSYGAYYSGGSNLGTYRSGTTSDMTSQVEGMLSESAMSQAYLIGLQAEMGNQQVTVNAVSNTLNMKQMSELAVIRNLKTA